MVKIHNFDNNQLVFHFLIFAFLIFIIYNLYVFIFLILLYIHSVIFNLKKFLYKSFLFTTLSYIEYQVTCSFFLHSFKIIG